MFMPAPVKRRRPVKRSPSDKARDAFFAEMREVAAHPERFKWTRLEDIE